MVSLCQCMFGWGPKQSTHVLSDVSPRSLHLEIPLHLCPKQFLAVVTEARLFFLQSLLRFALC